MFNLSNKVYDTFKWIATIFLPALATFYVVMANVWGFPYGEQISATIMAVVTFMCVLLQISALKFKINRLMNDWMPAKWKVNEYVFAIDPAVYDVLKYISQLALPGLATFYFTLAQIWSLPYADSVSATIMGIVAFMNALLAVNSAMYFAHRVKQ